MQNKRCFLVTAYCNTEEKKQVLEDTLKNISKYGLDIILFSHFPVEQNIYDLTTYCIYDYSNPVISSESGRSIVNWEKFYLNDIPFKINTHAVDYGYAAAQQIKRGIIFADKIGYEEVIVLNYDLVVTDKMVEDFYSQLDKYDSITLMYGREKAVYMAWFALKIKTYIDKIKTISLEEYRYTIEENIVEQYIYTKVTGINSLEIPEREWGGPGPENEIITTSIVMEGSVLQKFVEKDFNWFIGHEIFYRMSTRLDSGKEILLLWELKKDLDIEVYVKDKLLTKTFIPKEWNYQVIHLPVTHAQFTENTEDLEISINGWRIPKNFLLLNKMSSIEIAHNE